MTMDRFVLNGYLWSIKFVSPLSPYLVDRTGRFTVGTTDPTTNTVYISNNIHGSFLNKVIIHEIGHCALVSFGLLIDIHRMVKPEYWIEAEEWVCNFIADYGLLIFNTVYKILGEEALYCIPNEIEKMIS